MFSRNSIIIIFDELGKDDKRFLGAIDKIVNAGTHIINSTEELREELIGYDDIYQTHIIDLNFDYWFQVTNGTVIYKKGINPDASFKMNFTKDLIIKILKNEISGTDAFMKGKIRVEGDISQGLRYVKLFRLFTKYLEKKNGKNE